MQNQKNCITIILPIKQILHIIMLIHVHNVYSANIALY